MKQEIMTFENKSPFSRQEIKSFERMMTIRTDRSLSANQKKILLAKEMQSHLENLFGGSQ